MPSEVRRLMFFHSELFDALTAYAKGHGHNFIGDKIVQAKLASQSEYDFHTQKEFRTEISEKYNIKEMKNAIVVTFFDDKTFEHRYYNLPASFVSEALIEYSLSHNIPLPKNSKKRLDITEFNVCLDVVIDGEEMGKLKLSLEDD